MVTSIPSGLGTSVGITTESVVGTFTTASMRWLRSDKAPFNLKKTTAQSLGLHQGMYQEGKRRQFVQREAQGNLSLDLADKQLGLVLKHMLGANPTATQQGGTTAYLQTVVPADLTGLTSSIQLGVPFTNGTIQQMNYSGCKIVDWMITQQRGQLAKLDLTIDGKDETTATSYAAPTFVAADVFSFNQFVVKLGGTPSTNTGVTSIAAGAAPTGQITTITIKGTNPMKIDRFAPGSQTKAEQLANHFRLIEISFDIEWGAIGDVYNAFTADTSMAFEATWTGAPNSAGAGFPFMFDVIVPQLWIDDASPLIEGPDVILQHVKAVGLDDGTNNQIQIQYQSTDTTV